MLPASVNSIASPEQSIGRNQRIAFSNSLYTLPPGAPIPYPLSQAGFTRSDVKKFTIAHNQAREERGDKREAPNPFEFISGKEDNSFTGDGLLLKQLTPLAAPDIEPLLIAHGMERAGVPAKYTIDPLKFLPLAVVSDDSNFGQVGWGGYVSELKFTLDGLANSLWAVNGNLASAPQLSSDTLTVLEASGAGPHTLVMDNVKRFQVGTYVQKLAGATAFDDNVGVGFLISGIDIGANTITVEGAFTVAWSIGDTVAPLILVDPVEGTALNGISGAMTFDDGTTVSDIKFTKATITSTITWGNNKPCYGALTYDRAFLLKQLIKVDLELYGLADQLEWMNRAHNFETIDMNITAGVPADGGVTFNFPFFELQSGVVDIPEVDQIMVPLTGVAKDSSLLNDAMSIQWGV